MDLPEEKTELLNFSFAVGSLARFLRREVKKYCGYSLKNASNPSLQSPSFDTYKQLSHQHLRYILNEQNRDKIDEVLAVAFRLGMEQGYRQRLSDEKSEEFCRIAEKAQKKFKELTGEDNG